MINAFLNSFKLATAIRSNLTFRIKLYLLAINFTFYDHFSILLLVLCTFETFLAVFWRFGKLKTSKMADPRWRLFGSHDVNSTSYDVIISCFIRKKKHFWTYYISSTFVVVALMSAFCFHRHIILCDVSTVILLIFIRQ